mgnify:CR=1 FL=1
MSVKEYKMQNLADKLNGVRQEEPVAKKRGRKPKGRKVTR